MKQTSSQPGFSSYVLLPNVREIVINILVVTSEPVGLLVTQLEFNSYNDGPLNNTLQARLLIDCFKTIEYFRFQFWSQNHCLFLFNSFFQKNLESIAFPIVCEKGVIPPNRTA